MKKSQRKARIKELKQRQKERRKQQHEPEQAQPAPQPAADAVTKEVMETTTDEIFSTEEVRGALRGALETVLKVMRMVNKAIDAVNEEDADKVFAARVTAQRKRDDFIGVRSDENSVIRMHPLFVFWKLAGQCSRQIETLLRLTNPKEFAKWKLAADKAAKHAAKLEQQAQKAAA